MVCDAVMTTQLQVPGPGGLTDAVAALRDWQHDDAPMQLHPGDIGWFWRLGAEASVSALRSWTRNGRVVAVGLLDGPETLRLTTAPELLRDEELAQQMVADLTGPEHNVLRPGEAAVEAPTGALVHDLLSATGWKTADPWTPLRREFTGDAPDSGLRIEIIGPQRAHVATAVHRSAFGSPKFNDESWLVMAGGLPFADARCLVAYDRGDVAVATATVWSAGPGRPGLLEPLGVHSEHRGRGYGTAIALAAAAALQDMGSSSAMVCTPTSNVAAVAAYRAAGYVELPQRWDRTRSA